MKLEPRPLLNKSIFWSNLFEIGYHNFSHTNVTVTKCYSYMTTSTIYFELHDKKWFVSS